MRSVENNSNLEFTKIYLSTITEICFHFTKIKIINDVEAKTEAKVLQTIWLNNFKKQQK